MKLRDHIENVRTEVIEFRDEVRVELAEIKKDLAEHMRRTALLEGRQERHEKFANFLTIAGRLLVVGAAGAAIARLFLG